MGDEKRQRAARGASLNAPRTLDSLRAQDLSQAEVKHVTVSGVRPFHGETSTWTVNRMAVTVVVVVIAVLIGLMRSLMLH